MMQREQKKKQALENSVCFLETKKMCVGYQKKVVLQDIGIGIGQGEILTIIGPNGAGKSTILKSIAGQLKLLGGTVYLEKEDLTKMSGEELSKRMAVVFTQKLKGELMTCEDVVATGRYPYTGRMGILSEKDHEAVAEAMELVDVTPIRDQAFECISDGQRQRVMLARAICQEPQIIILDEPTSFLDIRYKLEFLSVLQKLKEQKKLTVIMSLHELELAERISDKILCVDGRDVVRLGTPEEIFRSGYMKELFGIRTGNYDEENGVAELSPPKGEPKVFVIAGGGEGRSIFRKLQRKQIPFATGILYENDLDYPVAKALAAQTVSAKAFEPVENEAVRQAKKLIDICEKVICNKEVFGTFEKANEALLLYAKEQGKADDRIR